MRIDQETIDRIRQAADVVEVISDYVSLKKRGANMMGCCPFHGEKTPSFSVSAAKGIYKCFGCGKAGDSVRFVMDIEGMGYPEALRHLAKKYGIEIQETVLTDEQVVAQNERESLFIVLEYAKNYFQKNLLENDEGKSIAYPYFKERGFSDKTIKTFELGYSLTDWSAFTNDALKHGYSLEILEKAGLSIIKDNADSEENKGKSKNFDRFRGRVIFPIHNVAGRVIAFGARILKPDKNAAKYLNSPETEVYHKSDVLYGISQAKSSIRAKDVCYLVEGYTDVVSLHQAGIENVVASSGTSLTQEQIKLIARFTQNITVLYDGDSAGIKAALRGMDMILAEGLNVSLVLFPDGEDPDSYVQKVGSEEFEKYIQETSKDFITFKAEFSLKLAGTDPFKRAEIIKEMVESISLIPDAIKRSVFFQKTAELMKIDESILITEANKVEKTRALQKEKEAKRVQQPHVVPQRSVPKIDTLIDIPINVNPDDLPSFSEEEFSDFGIIEEHFVPSETPSPEIVEKEKIPEEFIQEAECIRLMLNFGHLEVDPGQAPGFTLIHYFIDELEDMVFVSPIYSRFYEIFKEKFEKGEKIELSYFTSNQDETLQSEAVNLATERHFVSENWEKMHEIIVPTDVDKLAELAFTNILRLKKAANHRTIQGLIEDLKMTTDENDKEIILSKYIHAKSIERQIASELGTVVVK